MVKRSLLIFFLVSFGVGFAQPQYPSVTNFTGTAQVNGTVHLEFTISESVFTAGSYDLQRSDDSAFSFISVNYYPGAVGGISPQTYTYDDYPPDPSKKYYYKVVFPNGSQSAVIIVNLGDVYGEYRIMQHPIVDDGNSRLNFAYKQGQQWILEIADPKGFFLYRLGGINQSSIIINASWFKGSGIYFFRLYPNDGSTVIPGRFVVLKQD
ncbi:MAG: hypothetical protein K0S33_856 [Bacteroidetes bacterium]|jgi:hypothetical protein|nr:hypothetical protein [Bacteroidota bacterium]